ncbi:ABC transporter permease [Cellulomonas sp. DKR-3]|uniref:ABC transporter permease n=1 Tax=Cellulomonas fulva TaxID=2835530 RepID=A0ABS5U0F9_9CELL|nr:ABC transporter permease [Cellulomonas fulva]MBT0994766.1 ABC transporter permease [Cellulomonas fulva]
MTGTTTTTSTTSATLADPTDPADRTAARAGERVARTGPARGLVNLPYLAIELRRVLRNRRTVVFTLAMPPVFFLLFGTVGDYQTQRAGYGNVTAWVMVSMALYGALLATTNGGASVSVERAQGWTRQLRLTPLRPATYVTTKVLVAMILALASMVITTVVGLASGADAPVGRLVAALVVGWVGSAVFAAFGLFMGYLLPSENVMQVLGPVLALLSFAGGLFMPLGDGVFATVARFMPTYGLAELTRAPIGGDFSWWAVVNVVVWGAVFVWGAAWRFRRDTARV